MKQVLMICALAIILGGCSALPSSPAVMQASEDKELISIDLPSERRVAWASKTKAKDGLVYGVCAEPPSDTGLSTSQVLNLTANLPKGDAEAGLYRAMTSALTELKGRTPAVLALRDVMYRMCEARMHGEKFETTSTVSSIYKEIVEVIGTFAAADLAGQEEQRARAEAALPTSGGASDASNAASWGVVFGADRTLAAAKPEVGTNAEKWGLTNAKIYLRRGVYRSVAIAKDRADAEDLLYKAHANAAGRSPYIVNLATWCPRPTEGDDFIECK